MFACCLKEPKSAPDPNPSKHNQHHSKSSTKTSQSLSGEHKGQVKSSRSPVDNNNSHHQGVLNTTRVVTPSSVVLSESKTHAGFTNTMATGIEALVSRLEVAVTRLEGLGGQGSQGTPAAGGDGDAPSVLAYDEAINSPLSAFLEKSKQIGGDVAEMVQMVEKGFAIQRDYLVKASKAKEPDQKTLPTLLKPVSDSVTDVQNFRESHRRSQLFNHLSALSESIPALGWVTVSPKPGPFLKDMMEAGQFYSNRVLKDYKEKEPVHKEWVQAWNQIMNGLHGYIRKHHTTGIVWNPNGVPAASLLTSSSSVATGPPAPPPPAGGPPPPPPPPPPAPAPMAAPPVSAASSGEDRNALFAALNQGSEITKGLKKVSDAQKTHKNPALRQGPAPFKPRISPKPSRAADTPAPKQTPAKKKPVFELQGKKWVVEFQEGNNNLVMDDVQVKQTVYIYKCVNSVVQVKGKVNSITMDSCKKCGVVCDNLVSTLEFVNCQSVQGQVNGTVPTVSMDKTDGCSVYVPQSSSLKTQFISAKSSEMNIAVTQEDGDVKEYPIAEQFKTMFDGKKFVTTTMDLNL